VLFSLNPLAFLFVSILQTTEQPLSTCSNFNLDQEIPFFNPQLGAGTRFYRSKILPSCDPPTENGITLQPTLTSSLINRDLTSPFL